MNEGETQERPGASRALTLVLIAILINASCFLFYISDSSSHSANITALLAIPAALGGLFFQLIDSEGEQSMTGCFVIPTVGLLLLVGIAWLAFGEGAICIAMVLPLWLPAAIAGALVSRWNAHRRRQWAASHSRLNSASWLALPLVFIAAETIAPPSWEEQVVNREVLVTATPERIWPLLLSIPNIGLQEGQANFTQDVLGVPRPSDATLAEKSGALIRIASWAAGAVQFEERIVELRPNQAIGWAFAFPNESVQKYTDRHISPDGETLKILTGRYELTQIAPGVTRVRLTTRYRMKSRLSAYLDLWGKRLLGDIQTNVLTIVKDRAEK